MCIYQRTAVVWGNVRGNAGDVSEQPYHPTDRLCRLGHIGYLGLTDSHRTRMDIQTAANPFFATCEFVPNLP